jgi:hypothetical protein
MKNLDRYKQPPTHLKMEYLYEMCTKYTIMLSFTDLLCLIFQLLVITSKHNYRTADSAWKSILNKPQYFSIKLYINKTVIKIHDQNSNKVSINQSA